MEVGMEVTTETNVCLTIHHLPCGFQGVLEKINESMEATTVLLKGMEGSTERKAKKRKDESDLLDDTNSLAGSSRMTFFCSWPL